MIKVNSKKQILGMLIESPMADEHYIRITNWIKVSGIIIREAKLKELKAIMNEQLEKSKQAYIKKIDSLKMR